MAALWLLIVATGCEGVVQWTSDEVLKIPPSWTLPEKPNDLPRFFVEPTLIPRLQHCQGPCWIVDNVEMDCQDQSQRMEVVPDCSALGVHMNISLM